MENNVMTEVERNRQNRKWTNRELAGRLIWASARPLFRYSPKICWGWRRLLLRLFGAKIGRHVNIHPTAVIFIPWNLSIGDWSSIGFDALVYNLGFIQIGSRVTISQRAHLCAGSHDYRDPTMQLLKLPIVIENDVWICADAFIGPNITIGMGTVVGARAALFKDTPAGILVGGNPAKELGKRETNIKS